MRLPSIDELEMDEERNLREHDEVELHSPTPTPRSMTYQRRLDVIVHLVERYAPRGVILDAACAQANVAITLAEQGRDAIGVDLRPRFLSYAGRKDAGGAVTGWIAGSLEALPIARGTVAAIVLGEVVEHVAHPERLLGQASDVLAPGGIVVVSTPNGDRLHTGLPNLADILDRSTLESRQFQPDADGHLFLLTKRELTLVGTAAGLSLVSHQYIQTSVLTGWPKLQPIISRLSPSLRLRTNQIAERTRAAALISAGQVAVFQK